MPLPGSTERVGSHVAFVDGSPPTSTDLGGFKSRHGQRATLTQFLLNGKRCGHHTDTAYPKTVMGICDTSMNGACGVWLSSVVHGMDVIIAIGNVLREASQSCPPS